MQSVLKKSAALFLTYTLLITGLPTPGLASDLAKEYLAAESSVHRSRDFLGLLAAEAALAKLYPDVVGPNSQMILREGEVYLGSDRELVHYVEGIPLLQDASFKLLSDSRLLVSAALNQAPMEILVTRSPVPGSLQSDGPFGDGVYVNLLDQFANVFRTLASKLGWGVNAKSFHALARKLTWGLARQKVFYGRAEDPIEPDEWSLFDEVAEFDARIRRRLGPRDYKICSLLYHGWQEYGIHPANFLRLMRHMPKGIKDKDISAATDEEVWGMVEEGLIQALDPKMEKDSMVRLSVIEPLGLYASPEARAALEKALWDDPDKAVQNLAHNTLKASGVSGAVNQGDGVTGRAEKSDFPGEGVKALRPEAKTWGELARRTVRIFYEQWAVTKTPFPTNVEWIYGKRDVEVADAINRFNHYNARRGVMTSEFARTLLKVIRARMRKPKPKNATSKWILAQIAREVKKEDFPASAHEEYETHFKPRLEQWLLEGLVDAAQRDGIALTLDPYAKDLFEAIGSHVTGSFPQWFSMWSEPDSKEFLYEVLTKLSDEGRLASQLTSQEIVEAIWGHVKTSKGHAPSEKDLHHSRKINFERVRAILSGAQEVHAKLREAAGRGENHEPGDGLTAAQGDGLRPLSAEEVVAGVVTENGVHAANISDLALLPSLLERRGIRLGKGGIKRQESLNVVAVGEEPVALIRAQIAEGHITPSHVAAALPESSAALREELRALGWDILNPDQVSLENRIVVDKIQNSLSVLWKTEPLHYVISDPGYVPDPKYRRISISTAYLQGILGDGIAVIQNAPTSEEAEHATQIYLDWSS
ncbi:MAG: HEAT repeat domain-containing protein [Candidatus Omnitrophica bacterium]|nr:HEAT repeat domain-containing protein [Candidatus Omnitrophota bacterium]